MCRDEASHVEGGRGGVTDVRKLVGERRIWISGGTGGDRERDSGISTSPVGYTTLF